MADVDVCYPLNPNNPLRGLCNPDNISRTAIWGNQTWVRTDCRETTFYQDVHTAVMPVDSRMAQDEGVVDINFASLFSAE